MWNSNDISGHYELPSAVPDQEYDYGAGMRANIYAPYLEDDGRPSYNYDAIIRGAAKRAEPSLYASPPEPPQYVLLDQLRPQAERVFISRSKIILDTLKARLSTPVPLAELSALIHSSDEATQHIITQINTGLKEEGDSRILGLTATPYHRAEYLLEPALPVVIRETQNYQLMRHSFCCKNQDGSRNHFGLRDDEFHFLRYIIDQNEHGAGKKALVTTLEQTSSSRPNDRSQLTNLVNRLNRRLAHSTIKICNIAPSRRPAHYMLLISTAAEPARVVLPADDSETSTYVSYFC